MNDFRQIVEHCELHDIEFWGPMFTWSNNQDGNLYTKECLDRPLANLEWHMLHPIANVQV
jgi:hypothetical protein